MSTADIEIGDPTPPSQVLHSTVEVQVATDNVPSPKHDGFETPQTVEKYHAELDWNGPKDPDNPYNWSFGKKAFHTALPALYCFVIVLGTSVYVPAIPYIQHEFDVTHEVAVLPLSMYTLGLALGPIISAPSSEMFGRRPVYLTSFVLLIVFIGGASQAQNIQSLIICRFFAGAGGSSALAVGGASVEDIWDDAHAAIAGVFFIMAPFLGTAFGFLTGAYIIAEYDNNWRWCMYAVLIVAAPPALASIVLRETSKKQILHARLSRRGTPPPTQTVAQKARTFLQEMRIGIARPTHMLLSEPMVSYLSIYTGFAFAMVFSFFGSYTYVYYTVYHFTFRQIGLCFLGLIPGYLLAVVTFSILDRTLYRRAAVKVKGMPAPEHRLYAAMFGSVLLPIALFWFAWSARPEVHWIVPVLAGIPFGWGNLMIFLSAITYLMDVYGAETGASAIAANGILRYVLGAAFPLFTTQMYTNVGIPWSGSIFGFIAVAMMPIPWLFFFYGRRLRERSSYETSGA